MKKTPIALGILERELVRQIIKLAAEGPLAQPEPMQPVKPNTVDPVVKELKPIAPLGKTTGALAGGAISDQPPTAAPPLAPVAPTPPPPVQQPAPPVTPAVQQSAPPAPALPPAPPAPPVPPAPQPAQPEQQPAAPAAPAQQQAQPAQQQQAQQPGQQPAQQPAQAVDHKPYETVLNDPKATPEQKEAARTDYAKKWVETNKANISSELKLAAEAWQKNPNSPEAKPFADQQTAAFNNLVKQQLAQNPEAAKNPDTFGQIVAGATDMWKNMGTAGQMALAFGVPMAMVSLLGGSGLGMLLGGLGLGFAGAAGGMFGTDVQQMTQGFGQSATAAIGTMLGAPDPEEVKKQVAAVSQLPPEQQKAEMEKIRAQVGPWAKWSPDAQKFMDVSGNNSLPNQQTLEAGILAAGKQGPEQARAALEDARKQVNPWAELDPNAQKFMTESADPNFLYNRAVTHGHDNFAALAAEQAPVASWLVKPPMQDDDPNSTSFNEWFWGAHGSKERDAIIKKRLADRGWAEQMVKQQSVNVMRKVARCWAGYEPVPGTKAYSEGSCRPKGSKKTKKEVIQGKNHSEKKAGGPGTGSFTLGSHQSPAKVTYSEPMSPDMVNTVRGILQKHPRYSGNNLEDPATVHRAALSMMKLKNAPSASSGAVDVINEMHNNGIPGLNGFPAPPVKANPAVAAAAPAQQAMPAQRPQPAPQPNLTPAPRLAPAPKQTPPPTRRDGRPTMTAPPRPPQTTSTGPVQPPVSSIGANGQYQPSVFSSKGVGLPR